MDILEVSRTIASTSEGKAWTVRKLNDISGSWVKNLVKCRSRRLLFSWGERLYLSMILGANFSSESGPEIFLNVSLVIRFGGHLTTTKGATWLLLLKKGATSSLPAPILPPAEA